MEISELVLIIDQFGLVSLEGNERGKFSSVVGDRLSAEDLK